MTIVDQITDHVHARKRLPNRRAATSFDFEHNGIRFVATYSPFPDGGVGEIFISNHKAGSHLNACVRDLGVVASLALQFGCPLDTLRRALLRHPRAAGRRRRSTPPPPNATLMRQLRAIRRAALQAREEAQLAYQFAPNSYGALAQIELILVRLAIAIIDVI